MKKFACWCVYGNRADKYVKVMAHDKAEARKICMDKEQARGIRSIYGVYEVNAMGLYV